MGAEPKSCIKVAILCGGRDARIRGVATALEYFVSGTHTLAARSGECVKGRFLSSQLALVPLGKGLYLRKTGIHSPSRTKEGMAC